MCPIPPCPQGNGLTLAELLKSRCIFRVTALGKLAAVTGYVAALIPEKLVVTTFQ